MHLGLIGYGTIAAELLRVLAAEGAAPAALDVLVRAGRVDAARARLGSGQMHEDAAALIAGRPDLVVEAATHEAVVGPVCDCLRAGLPVLIVSIGALANPEVEASVRAAAIAGGTQAFLCNGAVGGIDMLGAARLSGIDGVTYISRKPPSAWKGTQAEDILDLTALTEAATFFTGSARDAAAQYPKNANVAATIALAGAGFDATEVQMIADPGVTANIHEVSVRSGAVNFDLRLEGLPSPDNPKTSLSTIYSLARAVLNRTAPLAI